MKGGTLIDTKGFSDQEIITCGRKAYFNEANSVNIWLKKPFELLKVNVIILEIFHHGERK